MEPGQSGVVHSASAGNLSEFLPIACDRRASAKLKLRARIAELPEDRLEAFGKELFGKLTTVVLQVISKQALEAECVPLVAICRTAADAGRVCAPLVDAVLFLHGVLPLLDEGNLLESAHSVCALWYARKYESWEDVWLHTFQKAVQLSLTVKSKVKAARMRRLAIEMKDALSTSGTASLDSAEKQQLYGELAKCAVSPRYLNTVQGRNFVGFLLSKCKSLAKSIYTIMYNTLPLMSSDHVQMLAQSYIIAWKAAADKPQASVLEGHFQDIVYWTVNGDFADSHRANLFKFLKELHLARKDRSVCCMLCRCYLPILWRSFKVQNYKIRYNAAKIFFDSFPLVENANDLRQELAAHFEEMRNCLRDVCPDVRAVAVEGVLRVLTDFFEIIPVHERKSLVKQLMNENAKDMNSTESRMRVNKGLSFMSRNPKAHNLLKTLIVKNKESLDDVDLVQLSYVSLLLESRRVPGFKFWVVVEPQELLPLMADDQPQLSLKVAELLRNSYYNPKADQRQNLERSLLLHSLNRVAFRIFFTFLADIAPLKSILEFLATICQVLRTNSRLVRENSVKENVVPGNSVRLEQSCTEVTVSGPSMTQLSAHVLIETMAITYSTLSTRKELACDDLKEHWKELVVLMKATVNELFPTTESLSMQISLLTVASLLPPGAVSSNMSMRCFSLLRSFLTVSGSNATVSLPSEAKACVLLLCGMHRAADILALVDEAVDDLKSKQMPAKRRRVHFKVEQPPCNPDLVLQVLRLLLETPRLQQRLLRDHIVPLFRTWSSLLQIVDSMEGFLRDSRVKTPFQDTVMSAYHMFLLLTYVLHGQQNPVTREQFKATQALHCQMNWIEESLLTKLRRRRQGCCQESCIQLIKIYLTVARSVLMTTWGTFQFAVKFLTFLALCKETVKGDHLKADVDAIFPLVKKFQVLFVHNKQQASVIDALLNQISSESV